MPLLEIGQTPIIDTLTCLRLRGLMLSTLGNSTQGCRLGRYRCSQHVRELEDGRE